MHYKLSLISMYPESAKAEKLREKIFIQKYRINRKSNARKLVTRDDNICKETARV